MNILAFLVLLFHQFTDKPKTPIHAGWILTEEEDCRPGHGFGDKNHCHIGAPGHSTVPTHDKN